MWGSSRQKQTTASALLARTVRHGGVWAGVLAAVSLLGTGAETLLPAVLGRAVDGVLGGAGGTGWPILCAALVTIAAACDITIEYALGASTATATARLRHVVLRKVLRLGPEPGLDPGDVTSRLVTATADAGNAPSALVLAVTGAIPPIGAVIALLLIDPWLALAFGLGLPAVVALLRAFVRDTSAVVGRYLETQGVIAARLVEALSGNRTIAAAGTADREADRILGPLPELARHGRDTWRVQASAAARGTLAVPLLQAAVLAVAGWRMAAGALSAGGLLAAAQYASLGAGLGPVIMQLGRLARASAGVGRLVPVLDRTGPAYGSARLPTGPGRLEFRGVRAAAVDRIDLEVPGGRSVAVVGRSGADQSLVAALAGRLGDPDEGEIRLDGVPLGSLAHADLRRAVGYAFARPHLFGDTIMDALLMGPGEGAPEPAAVAAAEAARADAFIRRLPDGYHTPLARAPLSGGELQRLGLARAFAHPGRVLVLDDATSSVDTVTEYQIGAALTHDDRTRLIVARRASTAARADLVAWLDDGRVRAVGPHHELWADPEYRAVFR